MEYLKNCKCYPASIFISKSQKFRGCPKKKSTINNNNNNNNNNYDNDNNDNKKIALECSRGVPVSSVPIGCCTYYSVAGKGTVDGDNNKEDKTREEADMTPSRVFPKSSKVVQNCQKVS